MRNWEYREVYRVNGERLVIANDIKEAIETYREYLRRESDGYVPSDCIESIEKVYGDHCRLNSGAVMLVKKETPTLTVPYNGGDTGITIELNDSIKAIPTDGNTTCTSEDANADFKFYTNGTSLD